MTVPANLVAPQGALHLPTVGTAAAGADDSPFEAALRDAHGRLMAAHVAAVGTLEAELQRMRCENTLMRMRLAELGASADCKLGASSPSGEKEDRQVGAHPVLSSGLSQGALDQHHRESSSQLPGAAAYPKVPVQHPRPAAASGCGVAGADALTVGAAASPAASHGSGCAGAPPASAGLSGAGLAHAPPAAAPASQPSAHGGIGAGSEVELRGLTGRTDLNGRRATVVSYDPDAGRVEVRMHGAADEHVRCKLEHVLPADRPADVSPCSSAGVPARAQAEAAREADVIEVSTPAAQAAADAAREGGPAELEATLRAVLAQHGLRDLEVQRQQGHRWSVAGISFLLRRGLVTSAGEAPALLASCDGGCTWEPLQALVQQHMQRHAARGAAARPGARGDAAGPAREAPEAAASLADLQRRPLQRGATRPAAPGAGPWGEEQRPPGAASRPAPGAPLGPDGLPAWRTDGMPCFNDAFPAAFHASSGSSHYYSQFRVRVPSNSQYEQQQQQLHEQQ